MRSLAAVWQYDDVTCLTLQENPTKSTIIYLMFSKPSLSIIFTLVIIAGKELYLYFLSIS